MNIFKLDKYEQRIEDAINRGEFVPTSRKEFKRLAAILRARRKDAVLNLRVNSDDMKRIKRKAKLLGIKYQTFISEMIHRFAESTDKRIRAAR